MGDRSAIANNNASTTLECPENPVPAHDSGMQEGIRVGKKPLANLSWLPSLRRSIQRHVNPDRRSDNVVSRDAAPEAAVVGISPIVGHHEVTVRGNRVGHGLVIRLAAARSVLFGEFLAVDPDGAIVNVDGVSGQPDDALYVVRRVRGKRRLEDNHLLALGRAPQRHVPVGEGHAGVVPDATHDEVIADEQRVLHRARRNDARLADRAVNEQKDEANPEPGDDLALNLGFDGQVCFFLLFLFFSFHVPPPPAALRTRIHCHGLEYVRRICRWQRFRALPAAPDPSDKRPYNKRYRTCLRYHRPRGATPAEKRSPANRRQGTCRFLPACWKRRSALRAWGCP